MTHVMNFCTNAPYFSCMWGFHSRYISSISGNGNDVKRNKYFCVGCTRFWTVCDFFSIKGSGINESFAGYDKDEDHQRFISKMHVVCVPLCIYVALRANTRLVHDYSCAWLLTCRTIS